MYWISGIKFLTFEDMESFNLQEKKYVGGLKITKTYRWPKKLLQRLEDLAKEKGRTKPQELAFEILDMYLIQLDKKDESNK